ncbi:outer-membrane lipoprotein carrier protein LolA [Coleofasciculus sp.]|uniref:outer-membrane lipoprotein carrier protein LolA n=1 Tax=Coleofasciculus sp. TaxID=3100458 RepID=UPI0039F9EDC4
MNRLQKAITIFGITATVNAWGIIPSICDNGTLFSITTARAGQDGEPGVRVKPQSREVQVSPSESVVPNQITQSNPTPGMSRPLTDELDVSLLARTVANFIQAERYQTESEMQFSFEAQGFTGQFSVLVKTIAQSPQQFRTEISTPESGGFAQPTYILVSNGDQVWIYNPELKQYTVMDYERFDQSNNSFFIGFSSMLFLEMSAPFRQAFSDGGVTAEGVIDQLESVFKAEDDMPLQGNILNLEGQDYYAYNYKDRKAGFTFTFLVEPNTAAVDQLQISGKADGMDIKMTEDIIRRVPSPIVAADTFTFYPPAGVTQVESMEIDIF